MNNPGQLIDVKELIRIYEYDKECFTEMIYAPPYNNKAILVEVIRRLIRELSLKNQMIESAKTDMKQMEDEVYKLVEALETFKDNMS